MQSIDQLIDELAEVRKNGYSVDNQQVAEGIICFGATVLNSINRPIAAIAVSVLAETLSLSDRSQIISDVQRIACQLSRRMGAEL